MTTSFPHLLAPLQIRRRTLKNRVVMGSMHTRIEHLDRALERQCAFYEARAAGGAGMIVTGGFAPSVEGRMEEDAPVLLTPADAAALAPIVQAVHRHGTVFLLQILHAGRYAKHAQGVGVSASKSPINPRTPRVLSDEDIERTLDDFVRCARLAHDAGFDGVELMGSEGYLINQFTALRTNDRTDRWGGCLEGRGRFSVEVTRRIRAELGPDFIIMYRISAIDLVEGGATAADTAHLARAVEMAGADILNTGYGWHEAAVPTIAYQVPRGVWAFGARRLREAVGIPVVASNRFNTPDVAEDALRSGAADLISMARPFLADPEFVNKAATGRQREINTCIACNQSCLDHIFTDRSASCLVNPRAGREVEFNEGVARKKLRVAVVGAGPGGLAAALEAARRLHEVTLFEAADGIGGQLSLARRVPGKQEFDELLRYFDVQLQKHQVVRLMGHRPDVGQLAGFDRVIVATGVRARRPEIEGIAHAKVLSYEDVLTGRVLPGDEVAIIGTGGIAHDVAELLTHAFCDASAAGAFYSEWGVDPEHAQQGGIMPASAPQPTRRVTLFQRSDARAGARLGKSTGWIVRSRLRSRGVRSVSGVRYTGIDDQGLHYEQEGQPKSARASHVVICAGQEPNVDLAEALREAGIAFDCIGGALRAGELDAARAIDEGTRLANLL